ncbi:MAG: phosphoenolpyruvate--protein phosphotransferase [Phycisphaerae bacterium]|nr:phosphoenolpyruvate--protein phosphotransferase [Phycisphaerae bacterium]
MEILTGIAVCPGIAIAKAVVLDTEDYRIPRRSISAAEIEPQLCVLREAISASVDEIRTQMDQVADRLGHDAGEVFTWHIGVLQDPQIRRAIENLIRGRKYSTAYAVSTIMRNYQRRFMQMSDPLLAERIRDVQDIERRLLRNVLGESREDLAHLTDPAILVAHDISPSQAANLGHANIAGVVLDVGGSTSHTAILLRALGRPAVIGANDVSTRLSGGDQVIVDGSGQMIIAHPDAETLRQYRARQETYTRITHELDQLRDREAVTRDGIHIELMANIEFSSEAAACVEKGADGIGLYRTEYLFLRAEASPNEQEQTEAYRAAIEGAAGRPVVIRTFDLGADKYTQERQYEQERNPMLGLRSIRYSLQHLDMFKVQLRAVLRTSVLGNVKIMFPLITSLMEFRQAKMTLHDAMEDLEELGVPFNRDLEVGMMLETPAAALQCREFVREVDFVSIGTNDLVQYLLAVDRGNERVSRFYNMAHPAVLRILRDVIRTCAKGGVPCSLCGEMAGQPLYTLLLLGLGLRTFSMAPASIPEVKKLIRLTTLAHAERVTRKSLTFETERQVSNYLRDVTRKLLPDDPI